jgi:type I restriction enzyme R subunit
VPFLYATNGEVIRFHDVRGQLNLSRAIQEFHKPAALKEFFGRSISAREWFANNPPGHSRLRDYQKEANSPSVLNHNGKPDANAFRPMEIEWS